MSEHADVIKAIRKAARRRERALRERRAATDELRVVCTQARHAGVPISEIARVADLSRQGVYDLLEERA